MPLTSGKPGSVRLDNSALSRRDCLRIGFTAFASASLQSTAAAKDDPLSAGPKMTGRIYLTANLLDGTAPRSRTNTLIALDPETGEWEEIIENCDFRPRVSHDGRTVAFLRNQALWTRTVAGGEVRRVLDLPGENSGAPPVWSHDGKQIIISLGDRPPAKPSWVFKTLRMNADGSNVEELKIPPEDGVHDWSSDGEWLLTTSSRNAKIGWQLYVMHQDGTAQHQLTEGGNPFYTRFSPDAKRVLYSDGTSEERRGIWVVDRDGTNRRRIFPTQDLIASPCWSPDGTRIAIGIRDLDLQRTGRASSRIEVMDLEGEHRVSLSLPERANPDMPDWR
jgi:Tol biopolymer transport system component